MLDWGFWLWAIVGVGLGFGISALGVFTVPASLLIAFFLLTRRNVRASAFGVLVGIGAVLLLIAYINRGGPFNPRHWLIAGLVFIAAGLIGQLLTSRSTASRA